MNDGENFYDSQPNVLLLLLLLLLECDEEMRDGLQIIWKMHNQPWWYAFMSFDPLYLLIRMTIIKTELDDGCETPHTQ